MPLDDLPGALYVPDRDKIRDKYLQAVRIRNPNASTVEGTKEYMDAQVFADQAIAIFYNAKTIGDFVADVNKKGAALDAALLRAGTRRLPAAGGSGYVKVGTSVGGSILSSKAELKETKSGLRFQCIDPGLKTDGQLVAIVGVDTGPVTNLPAGTTLQWTSPPPGLNNLCTVIAQVDGSGLSGGRFVESDQEALKRLIALRSNSPASGNDAEYQATGALTPNVVIQQVFTYPCILGPGTIALTMTIRPGTPGASRLPNGAQLALVYAWTVGQFPADDSVFMCILEAQPVEMLFKVDWAEGAANWVDASPWPQYIAGDTVKVDAIATATTTSFRLTTTTATVTPQVGQTIGFYDQANGVFRRKRIGSVTTVVTNKSWDITCDTSNSSTDLSYVPVVGQTACPWSDSLASLVAPVVNYFDLLGPGEQVSPLPDEGLRMRRSPPSPSQYGSAITNRVVSDLFNIPAVGDIELVYPTVPFIPLTGLPGVSSKLLTLFSIAAFPE